MGIKGFVFAQTPAFAFAAGFKKFTLIPHGKLRRLPLFPALRQKNPDDVGLTLEKKLFAGFVAHTVDREIAVQGELDHPRRHLGFDLDFGFADDFAGDRLDFEAQVVVFRLEGGDGGRHLLLRIAAGHPEVENVGFGNPFPVRGFRHGGLGFVGGHFHPLAQAERILPFEIVAEADQAAFFGFEDGGKKFLGERFAELGQQQLAVDVEHFAFGEFAAPVKNRLHLLLLFDAEYGLG